MSERPVRYTTRVRRGLGLVQRLIKEEALFGPLIVGEWPADKRHDITHALRWIAQEAQRPPRKGTKKPARV